MTSPKIVDILTILVVSGLQAPKLMEELTNKEFIFTVMDNWGGVIQESTICLILGFHHSRFSILKDIVIKNCKPTLQYIPAQMVNAPPEYLSMAMVETKIGGASLYSMNVECFEQI